MIDKQELFLHRNFRNKLPNIRSQFLGGDKRPLYTPTEQEFLHKLRAKEKRNKDASARENSRIPQLILQSEEIKDQLRKINADQLYRKIKLTKLSVKEQTPQQKLSAKEKYPTTETELLAFLWKLQIEHQFQDLKKLTDLVLEKLPAPMYRAFSVIGMISLILNACVAFVKEGGFNPDVIAQKNQSASLTLDYYHDGESQPKNAANKINLAIIPEKTSSQKVEVQALDNDGFLLMDINQFGMSKDDVISYEKSGVLINIAEHYPNLRLINRERTQANEICLPKLALMISDYEKETGLKNVRIVSAHRGWYEQEISWAQAEDKSKVTLPGFSEHHNGCTFDFGTIENYFINADDKFYKWLRANAWKYGFVQSYTVERQTPNQTIKTEEWHWRWVGKEVATIWQKSQMSQNPKDLATILSEIEQTQKDWEGSNAEPQ